MSAAPASLPRGPYPIALLGILTTVAMLFAAFSAALLMRRGGTDWIRVALPPILWFNTALLLASSGAVELARRSVRRGAVPEVTRWLAVAVLLGVLFLAGQLIGWRLLVARGVVLPTSPHAAFFYMLSAIHGAYVVGGLGALGWTLRRAMAGAYTSEQDTGLTHTAIYWHVVGGVWVYLLTVLSIL